MCLFSYIQVHFLVMSQAASWWRCLRTWRQQQHDTSSTGAQQQQQQRQQQGEQKQRQQRSLVDRSNDRAWHSSRETGARMYDRLRLAASWLLCVHTLLARAGIARCTVPLAESSVRLAQ
jgi:hypothetical protein